MRALNDAQVEALAQANAYLNNAGLPTLVLQITARSNYGAPAIYPANETARIFADIADRKTLSLQILAKAKELGYRIEQVNSSICVPGLETLVGA